MFHNHPLDFLYARIQTGRVMVWWCPSGSLSVRLSVRPTHRPSGSPSACFSHFSPTCFDIFSWNFAYDFVLMYYGSSSSVVTLHQFLKELCLFLNSEYWKCEVFRTFLLHALRYWAEIVHLCTKDQVQVLSPCNVWLSVRPTIFCTCFLYALTIELEILNFTLVSLMSFFERSLI